MKRFLFPIALVLLVWGVVLWRRAHNQTPGQTPLEIGIWYWHSPFQIPQQDANSLHALNIREIYVRSGTFTWRDNAAHLIIPQVWANDGRGFPVHLVFNFDYTIAPQFGKIPNAALAQAVISGVRAERQRAERAGVNVVGIQFDLDCPTKRLPKYAELLQTLRQALRDNQTQLSITALPTWFSSKDLHQVAAQTDFFVPQYYEAAISPTLDADHPLSHLGQVTSGLKAGERFNTPFLVGIPAYGHARLYDDKGNLHGLFKEMTVLELLRNESFRLERSFGADRNGKPATPETFIGEEIHQFVAVCPAQNGDGKGFHVVYDLPTPALVAHHLAVVESERPANCRGVILFRYPQPNETMTLPWKSLEAALKKQPVAPHLRVEIQAVTAPWDVIETSSSQHPPTELEVTVTNDGNANAFLGKDAVTLTLLFDRAGILDAERGEFDSLQAVTLDPQRHRDTAPPTPQVWGENNPKTNRSTQQPDGTILDVQASNGNGSPHIWGGRGANQNPNPQSLIPHPSSLRFANAIVLKRLHLGVGETVKVGTLRVAGATTVRGWWTAKGVAGFATMQGEIPAQKILAAPRRKLPQQK